MTRSKKNASPDITSPRGGRGGSWSGDETTFQRAGATVLDLPSIRDRFSGFRTALAGRQPR